MPISYGFDYYSFVIQFEIRKYDASSFLLFFFLKIALDIRGLLWFQINFRIALSIPVKNVTGILIGITLNLWIALDSMGILTILIFPIQEHGISFHLFVCLLGLKLHFRSVEPNTHIQSIPSKSSRIHILINCTWSILQN